MEFGCLILIRTILTIGTKIHQIDLQIKNLTPLLNSWLIVDYLQSTGTHNVTANRLEAPRIDAVVDCCVCAVHLSSHSAKTTPRNETKHLVLVFIVLLLRLIDCCVSPILRARRLHRRCRCVVMCLLLLPQRRGHDRHRRRGRRINSMELMPDSSHFNLVDGRISRRRGITNPFLLQIIASKVV